MKSPEKPYRAGETIGVLLASSPLLGLLVTAYGTMRSFATLGDNGVTGQHVLTQNVGLALYATAIGLALCPVGVAVLVASLILRARAGRQSPPPLPAASST